MKHPKDLFWRGIALVTCSVVSFFQIWALYFHGIENELSARQVSQVSRTESSIPSNKIPIEKIKVGQRVQARNPEVSDQVRSSWNEPEWNQWVKLSLVMLKKDGTELKITMLRPESWVLEQVRYHLARKQEPNIQKVSLTNNTPKIPVPSLAEASKEKSFNSQTLAFNANGTSSEQAQDLVPFSPIRPVFRDLLFTSAYLNAKGSEQGLRVAGITVKMDLPELGAKGLAVLTGIEPAPAIKSMADSDGGPVVTATFHHASVDVIDLVVGSSTTSSDTETIGTTSNHPFWSVDRQKFVPAGDLKIGEALKSSKDSSDQYQVLSQLPRPGPTPVHNLEVHGEHTYYVGKNGILVHNSCGITNGVSLENGTAVTRFYSASDSSTLQSNLSRAGFFTRMRVKTLMLFPSYRRWRAHRHMRGDTTNSPFVSVLLDPDAGAASTDPWLRTIITGKPGMEGAEKATDLATFFVPSRKLIGPRLDNPLSIAETEMLFIGDNLKRYMIETKPNQTLINYESNKAVDKIPPEQIELDVMTSHGTAQTTLQEWINLGPGVRPFSRPVAARVKKTGKKLPLSCIPLKFRNTMVSRFLIRIGVFQSPWGKR